MKKGQLMGQPFILLFYVVVAALVLVFGVKIISDFKNTSEEVEIVNFVNEFKTRVAEVYADNRDSVISLGRLNVPQEVKEVCVLTRDFDSDFSYVHDASFREKLELGAGGSRDNLFLYGEFKKTDIKSYRIENLYVFDRNPTCSFVVAGKIDMRLRNEGSNVSVFTVGL